MPTRMFSFLTVVGLMLLPSLAQSAEETKTPAPGLVIQAASVDDLLSNFRYLGSLVGREEEAKQVEGLIKSMTGEKGLNGIDTKRPIALYGTVGPNVIDSDVIAVIPVADEKAFLDFLNDTGLKPEKAEGDIYKIIRDDISVPILFRFAHKHAYISIKDEASLAKDRLVLPKAIMPEGKPSTLSLLFRIDQVPNDARQEVVRQIKLSMDTQKEQRDEGATDAEHTAKVAILDEIERQVTAVVSEGSEAALRVDVDQKAGELSLELALRAKTGSALAERISGLGQTQSVVAGIRTPDALMNANFNMPFPEKLHATLFPAVMQSITKELQQEPDEKKRALAERGLKALMTHLDTQHQDAAITLRGPNKDGHYTLVGGIRAKDGNALEKEVRALLKEIPETEQKNIELDVAKVGDVNIHRLTGEKKNDNFFGEQVAYLAMRPDAVFFTLGADSLTELKKVLDTKPTHAQPFTLEVSIAKMARYFEQDQEKVKEALKKAFGEGKENDTIRISLEAGKELRIRAMSKAKVLTFFHLLEPTDGAASETENIQKK